MIMFRACTLIVGIFLTTPVMWCADEDGAVLGRTPCVLPDYEKNAGIERYALKSEYQSALADRAFRCERLTYSSSGLPVVAFLYAPTTSHKRPLPLVVFNRGGYVTKDQAPLLLAMFHRLAKAGFVVIAPMYRGSDGAPGHDEMGGADLAELKNVLPLAARVAPRAGQTCFYMANRGAE